MLISCFFFFNDTATTEIYTLSLHDALPICTSIHHNGASFVSLPEKAEVMHGEQGIRIAVLDDIHNAYEHTPALRRRSEEHTSELQSRQYLVCRLLLEKKKHNTTSHHPTIRL